MKFSFRLLARILFLLVVLVLFAIGATLAWFASWRSDKIAVLDAGSEIATTSYGDVEFAIRGEGPAVLVFHGAPGGYDQALLLGTSLAGEGYQIIAPSRPGYLRTPLNTGLLPEQQADAMAALLDTLGVQSAVVIGFSEGTPAAAHFALRHPGKISALVLVSPIVSNRREVEHVFFFGHRVLEALTGDIGSWLAVRLAESDPRMVLEKALEISSNGDATQRELAISAVLKNDDQLEWFQNFIGTFAPLSPRETGTRNDMLQLNEAYKISYANIQVPTLLIQGSEDSCVAPAEVKVAAGKIPTATYVSIDGAGHIPQIGPRGDDVRKKVTDFLGQYTGGQSQP